MIFLEKAIQMKADEIRNKFLEYFKNKGHIVVASSPLVPKGDPTLLFTNAGMVQFKSIFLQSKEQSEYKRAVSCQKCMRAGGKHNDLENVGKTSKHHTFFEMLGNFSFGDYFKDTAIELAWEFLTTEANINPKRLFVTVFEKDDEAADIWEKKIGISRNRIIRMGEKDNFWAMGDTGPCGPCSEIIIDQGKDVGCGRTTCKVGCDCDRFLELWNLVFMQYDRNADGRLTPLPNPCIDTGMGLERLAAVTQEKRSNYDSDLFTPIIRAIEKHSGKEYGQDRTIDLSIRAIADHSRAITFLIADGIQPSNEGRGYVLRRIIRRAARHGKILGLEDPFIYTISDCVIGLMGRVYPEIRMARDTIINATRGEEERFLETLSTGITMLEEEIKRLKGDLLSGDIAFRLYDTYGFPLDLTTDILKDRGLKVDEEGFNKAMEEQRLRAKEAWKGSGEEETQELYNRLLSSGVKTKFIGYHMDVSASKIKHIIKNNQLVDKAVKGEDVEIITDETPFYGESGGQLGDVGSIVGKGLSIEVLDTKRPLDDIIVHHCTITEGEVRKDSAVELIPDIETRKAISLNHTATHLLHAALRDCIGEHAKQAGSLVSPKRLRFDFYHFSSINNKTLNRLERSINARIRENLVVDTHFLSYREAIEKGALALFGEKYSDMVRLVEIKGASKELCGGIHVKRTGDIGLFKILSESSVATGIRRIEAVTGNEALKYIQEEEGMVKQSAAILKTNLKGLPEKITRLLKQQKDIEKEVEKLKNKIKDYSTNQILKNVKRRLGIDILATQVEAGNFDDLRTMADRLRNRMGSGVVILGCKKDGKALLLAAVTKDLTDKVNANNVIKELALIVGGRGGGRPDIAQAGGNKPEMLKTALENAYKTIQKIVSEGEEEI
jgi:alanyl-tRNA synthetase